MFLTNFFSEKKSFVLNNKNKIRLLIKKLTLEEEKGLSFLNIIFCSDEYLLEINKKHLKHDYYTDVITFDYSDPANTTYQLYFETEERTGTQITFNNILWYSILLLSILAFTVGAFIMKTKRIEETDKVMIKAY